MEDKKNERKQETRNLGNLVYEWVEEGAVEIQIQKWDNREWGCPGGSGGVRVGAVVYECPA